MEALSAILWWITAWFILVRAMEKIYAVNASNGTLRWSYQTQGLMRQRPIVVNGKLYANVRDTYIWYAINIVDGSLYWRGNAATDESLFVCGDVRPLYTAASNKLLGDRRAKYKSRHSEPLPPERLPGHQPPPRFLREVHAPTGRGYSIAPTMGERYMPIMRRDNTQAWYLDLRAGGSSTDAQQTQVDSGLIYDGGIIYHVADKGRITGIDSATGAIVFLYDAVGYPERSLWSTPEIYNQNIYVGGLDGKVYAVRYNGN